MDIKEKLEIEPTHTSWWELTWKVFIWLIFGWILAILLFLILTVIWWIFSDSLAQVSDYTWSNPILPLLIILIWFLVSFIWNLWICGVYHLFFSSKYQKIRKSIWIIAITNGILLIFLIPIYFIFGNDTNTMFMILWFHIILSWFLSSMQSEIIANPNYGTSSLIWSTLSLALIMLAYSIIWKAAMESGSQDKLYLLLLFPPVVCYGLLPFGQGIRERIYFKIYEIWNNPFYAESKDDKADISNTASETPENTLTETPSIPNENDDINIDIN